MTDIELNLTENTEDRLIILNTSKINQKALKDFVEDTELYDRQAPDGGVRAWLVMLGTFFCNGIIFGVINSYGVLYPVILFNLQEAGISEASSKAALIGSLTIGTTFAASPLAGILSDKIGIRRTTVIGGGLAAMGLFCSSFLTNTVEALCVTYGIMYGLGAALVFTPSLAILNHYFFKYLGLVNGIVAAGNSMFTILMPFVIEKMVKSAGFQKTLWLMAALVACIMFWAMMFKPLPSRVKLQGKQTSYKGVINVSIWKNKRFSIWVTIVSFSLFGYFVPYVHMKKFVQETFPGQDGKLPIVFIGITSGLGRLIFGYLADLPKVDRILLQQISFLANGIATICLPFCSSFVWLLGVTSIMGLFDGCFAALLGPNIFDMCGQDGAAQGIGFQLGLSSIPLILGSPLVGMLYDHTGSYQLPILLAGLPPIVGFLGMFSMKCVKSTSKDQTDSSQIIQELQVINVKK